MMDSTEETKTLFETSNTEKTIHTETFMIDIGANLTHKQFETTFTREVEDQDGKLCTQTYTKLDIDDILFRSNQNGVTTCIITGTTFQNSSLAIDICNGMKSSVKLYSTVGIHPHDAYTFRNNTIRKFREMIKNNCVVAIGETGLDYDRMLSSNAKQLKSFEEHVKLAQETNFPLFLHERKAHEDFVSVISKYKVRGVVHCFTGNVEEAKKYLELGYYIGITGFVCDAKRNAELLKALQIIPLDRLMIETDAPYMKPFNIPNGENIGGRRNEPMFLKYVVKKLAEIYKISDKDIIHATTTNAKKLFGI